MGRSGVARVLVVGLVAAVSLALVLGLKAALLVPYLRRPVVGALLAFAVVGAATWGAGRVVEAARGGTMGVMLAAFAFLFVIVMVTPMPYEVARVARDLPHPDGDEGPVLVTTSRVFDRGHPAASVVFQYPEHDDVAALAEAAFARFAEGGWEPSWSRRPTGEGSSDYALLLARRSPLAAHCTLGMRGDVPGAGGPILTMGCVVTV